MLMQDHRVFEMIKQVQQTQQTLLEIYEDRDGYVHTSINHEICWYLGMPMLSTCFENLR